MPEHLVERFAHRERVDGPTAWPRDGAVGTFLRASLEQPHQEWIFYRSDERRAFQLAEIRAAAAAFAAALTAAGCQPGDRLAIRLGNRFEAVCAFFGGLMAGATIVALSTRDSVDEMGWLLDATDCRYLVFDAAASNVVASASDALRHWRLAHAWAVDARGALPERAEVLDLTGASAAIPRDGYGSTVISYTSGSTAHPKLVVYGDRQLLFDAVTIREVLSTRGPLLVPSPVGHITGILNLLLMPLLRPDPVVAVDRWDPELVLKILRAEHCTELRGTALYVQALADLSPDAGGLQVAMVGGGPVAPALVERMHGIGVRLVRSYGSTEHPTISSSREEDELQIRARTDGRLLPGVSVRIVDDDGREVPEGLPGVILSRGPDAMIGYLDPEMDRGGYTPDGWFRTGDVGVYQYGLLTIRDRVKDIIIRAGENISAKEVEDALHTWSEVVEASVIAVPDSRYGERACAFIQARSTEPVTLEAMRGHLDAAGLAKFKWPEFLILVDEFPRTPSGKIRKQTLREQWPPPGGSE